MQQQLYKSPLNTPVYSDLNITGASYTNSAGQTIAFQDIKLASALIHIQQKKNIVFTSVSGSDSDIVEYIGSQNFDVTVVLNITETDDNAPSGTYPGITVTNLIAACQSNRVLKVNSWYMNQFGITDVVITDYDFPQTEGELFMQGITINMKSVLAFELQANLPNNLPIY